MKHKSSQSAACSTESSAKPSVRRWGVSMVAWALVLSMCAGLVFPAYAAENEPEPTETTAATETTAETVNNITLYPASNLPEVSGNYEDGTPRQITSIVALGELKPNTTMKMHISLGLDKGQPGDYLVNFLSQESLSCYARTQIVKRSLSGLCWLDSDKDGIQDAEEAMLSGINVTLVRLEGASYVPVCYPGTQTPITIQPGQLISVNAASNNEAEAYGEGLYKFTELPAGTYGVIFESGDTSINDYTASPVGAGTNTEADSDGIPTYSGATLLNTQITGIVMDPAASLSYGIQDSRYHDSGFYPTAHYELPLTGGVGTGLFIIPGFLLTTGAALGLRRKKNQALNPIKAPFG